MKEIDESVIYLDTLKYKSYDLKIQKYYDDTYNNVDLICNNKIVYQTTQHTSMEIFKDYIKLGEDLYNQNQHLRISNEIEKFIDINNLNNNTLKTNPYENFISFYFEDILNVINNPQSKQTILEWIKKYGVPNTSNEIYYIYDLKSKMNSNYNLRDEDTLKINSIETNYTCDITPLINTSIMFYLVYNLQKSISSLKVKFIKKLCSPFPYLTNYINDNLNDIEDSIKLDYDSNIGEEINLYIKKILSIINLYICESISARDSIINNHSYIDLPVEKEEVKDLKTYSKFNTRYLLRSPILYVYDYLLKVMEMRNFNDTIYHCDNCYCSMTSKQILCISCKLSLSNYYLEELNSKNKKTSFDIDKISTLIEELNKIKKEGVTNTPTLDKIYCNKRDQQKHQSKTETKIKKSQRNKTYREKLHK